MLEQENDRILQELETLVARAREPAEGRDAYNAILSRRHDYFGKVFCDTIGIPYRNDVKLEDILHECDQTVDTLTNKIPNITPDNFEFHNNILTIIDYKVAVSDDSAEYTRDKYESAVEQVRHLVPFPIKVCIIRIHPYTNQVSYSDNEFMRRFGHVTFRADFTRYLQLAEELKEKFADNPEFMDMIAYGDVTFTANWCESGCEELYDHNVFKEFMDSMPTKYQKLFLKSLNSSCYTSERWDTNLKEVKQATREEYESFISSCAKELYTTDSAYSEPSKEEILKGWEEMTSRISQQRNISSNVNDQKPSAHFIWTENNPELPTNNSKKICALSKLLQNIDLTTSFAEDFRRLGKLFDFSSDIVGYERHCEQLKREARSNPGQVKNKKLDPRKIGESMVLWEQQFLLSAEEMGKENKMHLLKDFFGIGKHKQFAKKGLDETKNDQPTILDFNDIEVKRSAELRMQKTKLYLSKHSQLDKEHPIAKEYMQEIKNCNDETFQTINAIFKTKYWQCITDISILMKNMLSVSQYNRNNTFRIATCANNAIFGLIFPSADIKTKDSSIVYCILAVHKDEKSLFNPGALHATHKVPGGFLSISKAMRLDKKRCHRIVTSPGIFLTIATMLKGDNPTVQLEDILNFSLYTSLNVTKSMLSLTEPSRYMIMNSLAVSSHVREYISEKFSPYTKTLFSVHMVEKIKNGCLNAFKQRELIKTRDIYLTDLDITQKGIQDNRDLCSIWFDGNVTLKEYLNQIYIVFYLNPKALHEKHHVMIDLLKTVIEIELDQRENLPNPWSDTPKKQTVNLPILIHSLAKNLLLDTSFAHFIRSRIENRNNFRRTFATISTFTSSKSCIKVGNFHELKLKQCRRLKKVNDAESKKHRIANANFVEECDQKLEVEHANYELMRKAIPNYIDILSTKVFDRLYELYKTDQIDDRPVIEHIFKTMRNHTQFYFTFFNKGQKTAKDREIFVGEYEAKMCMYLVERIYKERSKVNPDEMISEPGDGKLRVLERKAEQEIRFMVERMKAKNDELNREIENAKENFVHNLEKIVNLQSQKYKALKLEINADMSKWSAQDVFFKYFWTICLDPILYPEEKEHILFFFCNYMDKELVIPDEVICNILDQRKAYPNDPISQITNGLTTNHFNVRRNWLQGNFNYMSSYVHSTAMSVFKDIIKRSADLLEAEVLIHSMVHSDDNQTSVTLIDNRICPKQYTAFVINMFEKTCLTFGCQANMKKTYITNHIKEFVSLFNLYGEPFSIFGRFTLTSVGDCAYIGPYEDLASRISATQTGIKHGCPASLAWLSIAIAQWMTYLTYNMLPGQQNDPQTVLEFDRKLLPLELGGYVSCPLSLIALIGLEAGNVDFLIKLINKYVNPRLQREPIQDQCSDIKSWDITKFSKVELFKLKVLRYLVLDAEMDNTDIMGETSEMRGRSLLTPRKFTTAGSLRKLISFDDFQTVQDTDRGVDAIVEYMLNNPALLVTKGETKEDYMNTILYRYNSKKFKESLSIQNPTQLFLEQILFSHKPIIDYTGIAEKFSNLNDGTVLEDNPTIKGRMTFPDAFARIKKDLNSLPITVEDVEIVVKFIILNDPLLVTAANAHILHVIGHSQSRLGSTACIMPEFRNLRVIKHSPALVLKCYSKNVLNLPGVSERDMIRDINHLKTFIDATKLKTKMEERIARNEAEKNEKDIYFEVKELTRFYQTCYEYVKSTDYRVKVFILPGKTVTQTDFCATLQGSLLEDKKWRIVQHLRPVTAGGHKGAVQPVVSLDFKIAKEAVNLLCFFTDTFIDSRFRKDFLIAACNNMQYQERDMETLILEIENAKSRVEFIPFLYRMGKLRQEDLDAYDAQKAGGKVTWNHWQSTRSLNMGKIDFQIDTYKTHLHIIGEDQQLLIAELRVPKLTANTITQAGYKLLNEKHGFKFETMSEVIVRPNKYYITYQMKTKKQYVYKIFDTATLLHERRNISQFTGRESNPIVAVCEVVPMEEYEAPALTMDDLEVYNYDNDCVGMLKTSFTESAKMRRANLAKMQYFEGKSNKVLKIRFININALMKDTTLMSLNYDNLVNVDLARFSKLLDCDGDVDTVEEGILCFSEDPMEQTATEEIDAIPLFRVSYKISAPSRLTYKNAIRELLRREITKFMETFTFVGKTFDSPENMGFICNICCIIQMLHTNEWSTIMLNCIHICMIYLEKDIKFHTFSLNRIFFENMIPASGKLDYKRIKEFIIGLSDRQSAPWNEIFSKFKIKCIALLDREITKIEQNTNFADMLALPDNEIQNEGFLLYE
uniref:RNA-directed RNA polymerase L n=1 Tax=Lednice virus TaxID=2656737 RepID=A0A5P8N916_9VIRU|nr:RNA-dependent RNA polymerase [Lednice virus]